MRFRPSRAVTLAVLLSAFAVAGAFLVLRNEEGRTRSERKIARVIPVVAVQDRAGPVPHTGEAVKADAIPIRAPVTDGPKPPDVPDETVEAITLRPHVLFKFGEWGLTDEGHRRVGRAVAAMKRYDRVAWVRVEGHTDARGSPRRNLRLSRRRALTLARKLRAAGIPGNPRIIRLHYGEARPVAPNIHPDGSDDKRGRRLNRRVVITFKPAAPSP